MMTGRKSFLYFKLTFWIQLTFTYVSASFYGTVGIFPYLLMETAKIHDSVTFENKR